MVQNIVKSALLALVLVLALYAVYCSPVGSCLRPSQLSKVQQNLGIWGQWAPVFFGVTGLVAIGVGVPRTAVAFLAGGVFGFWLGVFLAEATAVGGALFTFLWTRWARILWEQPAGESIQPSRLKKFNDYVRAHGFLTIFLLRQLPLPGVAVNIAGGLSAISVGAFVTGSALGFLPQSAIFTLYGSGLQENFWLRVILSSLLLLSLSIVVYLLYRHSQWTRELFLQMSSFSPRSHHAGPVVDFPKEKDKHVE